jgi:hypothetical protein
MAKLGILNIRGGSGASYVFEVFPLSTVWTRVSAVYAVTHRDVQPAGAPEHMCVHLGQTANLQDIGPVPPHWVHRANCICILIEENEGRREEILLDIANATLSPPLDGG